MSSETPKDEIEYHKEIEDSIKIANLENNNMSLDPNPKSSYKVKVYVTHGYFEYSVSEMSSALEHAHLIMERRVYRRSNSRGEVEFHPVIKTKVCGEGLESEYPDTFKRT